MVPFFVQIKCELGKSYQVANELAEAEIASEIYSTAGDYDLLVKFYVDSGTDIGHFVAMLCSPLTIGVHGEAIGIDGGNRSDMHY